ncbi:MAG: hypothetical protein GY898_23305 [Proteobacteria bacterium]|nr:hypothetical protein [Pseudomonadota bacterium]
MLSLPLVACGGDSDTPAPSTGEVAPESTPEPELATAPITAEKLDVTAVRDTARTAMFVPAPSEFQAALNATKVDINLTAGLVAEPRPLEGKSGSIIALEAGVRMSTMLMTAADGDKAATLTRMRSAREGLLALNVPGDVLSEADKIIGDFDKGSIAAAELVPALDLLNEKLQDDLADSGDSTKATLVQAGGWLQGAHLLSTALAEKNLGGDAAGLVHQPSVLAYFTDFLNKSGAGDPAVDAVLAEMTLLQAIADKDALEASDMAAVATHTGNILAKF